MTHGGGVFASASEYSLWHRELPGRDRATTTRAQHHRMDRGGGHRRNPQILLRCMGRCGERSRADGIRRKPRSDRGLASHVRTSAGRVRARRSRAGADQRQGHREDVVLGRGAGDCAGNATIRNLTASHFYIYGGASKMRAARIHQFGAPDVIVIEETSRPEPLEGEVLVRINAAGVGPWDALIRKGGSDVPSPLPLTPGSDFSGIVESTGRGVSHFRPADNVYGAINPEVTGGYAEYACATAGMIARKPATLNDVEAASVPV